MTRPDGLEFKTLAVVNPVEPDATGVIEALVAVTGVKDEVGDIIEPGTFRRTLRERPRPKVCLGHDWNRPIGKTLDIKELMPGDSRLPKKTADGRPWPREAGALWARFQVNLDSDDGKSAFSAAKFYGAEQSTYSIGYRTTRARQRGSIRHIHDLDLFEYGPVLNPANRLATLQSIKSDGELTNLVDSERQDFEAGDGGVETKMKYVRDANYWGKPIGTPITPGMKPRGGDDRERGTSESKPSTSSFLSSLPSDEQEFARSLPTEQRMDYLQRRASGEEHEQAAQAVKPASKPATDSPLRADDSAQPSQKPVPDKPAPKPRKQTPKKPTAKQKALLFAARPGRIMTYRRDENGQKIYAGPFLDREGLIFRGHANSAFPMEQAGWVEAGYDGRHYILTPEGERLREQLVSEDSEQQDKLRAEQRVAALGPASVEAADANVDAGAAPMDMTPREYADREAAAQARRNRARNIIAEQAQAETEDQYAAAAEQAAALAPGAIDIDAFRRRTGSTKAELAGGGRMVLTGAGTKSWDLRTVDGMSFLGALHFTLPGEPAGKAPGKIQLRDLANRIAGIRDHAGRPVPFDHPSPDPSKPPEWVRGWRDATGADLQSAIADVAAQWAEDNDLPYRRIGGARKHSRTIPGGEPDAQGFRMRKAEELAPGDQVRLPNGAVGTVERSGADVWNSDWVDAKKIEGQVLLDDGRVIGIRELAGLEKPGPPKVGTGLDALSNAHVARRRGGNDGPAARDMVIPIKFAADADSPDAGHDPGMGSMSATATPPGREIDFSQLVYSNYVPSIAKTYEPLSAGTRVVQNEQEADRFLPRDGRAKVGTALPLVADFNGETFQTVRLDDGTYDQWRVRGVRGALGSEGAFEVDPSPERIDQVRAERGLSPVVESTPLQRVEPEPEPAAVQEVSTPAEPVQEVSTSEAAPATPPALTATETLPEQQVLPYEVIKKPNRSGKGARVRFNGREYNVDATSGVLAEVTVTDDDGHTATVAGGSSTLLRRDQFADRERALRQALDQAEAQHNAAPESAPESRTEPQSEPPASTPATSQRSPRPAAPGVLASQDAVLAALDRAAGANLDTRPGYASPSESAARIAEVVRSGDRKIATSQVAPPGLYMLSPPSHMAKGGYSWELQTVAGSRIPIEVMFGANSDSRRDVDRFTPKSGRRSSFLLEAIGETVRDADGNSPPFDNPDPSWPREWRDANGLSLVDSLRRLAVPAFLRKIGEGERADDYDRAQDPLPDPNAPTGPRRGFQKDPGDVQAGDRIYGDGNNEVVIEAVEPDGNYFNIIYTDQHGRTVREHYHHKQRVWIIEEGPKPEPDAPGGIPGAEVAPEVSDVAPEPETVEIPPEQLDEAATLQDEVLGITEQPDGSIEVTEEVAERQDRVASLIEQDDAGTLDLSGKSEPELTSTRGDLVDELRLQSVLATRQATPKPEIVTSPAGAPEKPPQRPGLAGAAEDYSEALQSGDVEAIARTRARLESSLRRSRAGSESARALADHITGEGDDDAEQLTSFARTLRRETRERRNAAAKRRRTARRLERVRIQSLIDKIDSELQRRTTPEPPTARRVVATTPIYRQRYGGMSDAELEAARNDARQRAQTDVSASEDLRMIRREMDDRELRTRDIARAPEPTPAQVAAVEAMHGASAFDRSRDQMFQKTDPAAIGRLKYVANAQNAARRGDVAEGRKFLADAFMGGSTGDKAIRALLLGPGVTRRRELPRDDMLDKIAGQLTPGLLRSSSDTPQRVNDRIDELRGAAEALRQRIASGDLVARQLLQPLRMEELAVELEQIGERIRAAAQARRIAV